MAGSVCSYVWLRALVFALGIVSESLRVVCVSLYACSRICAPACHTVCVCGADIKTLKVDFNAHPSAARTT